MILLLALLILLSICCVVPVQTYRSVWAGTSAYSSPIDIGTVHHIQLQRLLRSDMKVKVCDATVV